MHELMNDALLNRSFFVFFLYLFIYLIDRYDYRCLSIVLGIFEVARIGVRDIAVSELRKMLRFNGFCCDSDGSWRNKVCK